MSLERSRKTQSVSEGAERENQRKIFKKKKRSKKRKIKNGAGGTKYIYVLPL
jgi:hypothetical protein